MKKLQKYHRGTHTYVKLDKKTKQVIKDRKEKIVPPAPFFELPEDILPDLPDSFIIFSNDSEFVIDFTVTLPEKDRETSYSSTSGEFQKTKQVKVIRRVILSPVTAKKLLMAFNKLKI